MYLYCVYKTNSVRNKSLTLVSSPIKGQLNNGFIPDDQEEMKEVQKNNNGVSNGAVHHLEQIENEYAEPEVVESPYYSPVLNEEDTRTKDKAFVKNELQKSTPTDAQILGIETEEENFAIGLLEKAINDEEEDDEVNSMHNYLNMPVADANRKISVDAESLNSTHVHVIGSDFALVHREDETTTPTFEVKTNPLSEINHPDVQNQVEKSAVQEVEEKIETIQKIETQEPLQVLKASPVNEIESKSAQNAQEVAAGEARNISPQVTQEEPKTFKRQESQKSEVPETPPPPPPVPKRFHAKPRMPIPLGSNSSANSIKSRPQLPPQTSEDEPIKTDPQLEDHVKIGSKSHNAIASKLEHIFQKRHAPTVFLTKPIIHNQDDPQNQTTLPEDGAQSQNNTRVVQGINRLSAILKDSKPDVMQEGVEESSVIKPSDFKMKLTELLLNRTASMKRSNKSPTSITPDDRSVIDEEEDEDKQKKDPKTMQPEDEILKNVMGNVFQSIKLRKVDSFKVDDENESPTTTL